MNLETLTAENYRNIASARLQFVPGVNLLYGQNAQGKTNALECIYLFARGKSYRGSGDDQLIRFGEKGFRIGISFRSNKIGQTLEYRYYEGTRKRLKNGAPVKLSEMIGLFRAVLFCPEHLALVKGEPQQRRAFLNIAISQCRPIYLKLCDEYNKILQNRNCLLKEMQKGFRYDTEELWSWTERLSETAGKIAAYRIAYLEKLAPHAEDLLADLSLAREKMTLFYESEAQGNDEDEIGASYRRLFEENVSREIAAGCTLFGVHRDDVEVRINGLSARAYASQGQQRSVVLALKLAEGEVCRDETGEYPVFLFDDVMSELDETRRGYVLREAGDRQVILTACESGGFDPRAVNMIGVSDGVFTEETPNGPVLLQGIFEGLER